MIRGFTLCCSASINVEALRRAEFEREHVTCLSLGLEAEAEENIRALGPRSSPPCGRHLCSLHHGSKRGITSAPSSCAQIMNGDMASMAHLASLATDSPDHQQQQSPQYDDSNGNKRKGSDGGQTQQRAKRNRYISIACNECKRRKIKCNGNTPCQRCGNLNLECLYAPNCCSSGFKESQYVTCANDGR